MCPHYCRHDVLYLLINSRILMITALSHSETSLLCSRTDFIWYLPTTFSLFFFSGRHLAAVIVVPNVVDLFLSILLGIVTVTARPSSHQVRLVKLKLFVKWFIIAVELCTAGAARAENAPRWADTFLLAARGVQLCEAFFFFWRIEHLQLFGHCGSIPLLHTLCAWQQNILLEHVRPIKRVRQSHSLAKQKHQ